MKNRKKTAAPDRAANLKIKKKNYSKKQLDFKAINFSALIALPDLLTRWLPDGKRIGREWVALNPCRVDDNTGSFKINMSTGRWGDFATGEYGGDVISLAAYLAGIRQFEAASYLANMLGVAHE